MVSKEIIERNEKLVYDRLIEQINFTITRGEKYIDDEFNSILDVFWKPTVKFLYNSFAKSFIDKSTRDQIEVAMKSAKNLVLDENADFDDVIERNFDEYLRYDSLLRNMRKMHPNYNAIKKNRRRVFEAQVKPLVKLLNCEEDASSYNELAVKTFKTPENSKNVLCEQLTYMAEGFRKVQEDVSIINSPAGHYRILRILKKGYKDMRDVLVNGVEEIFDEYGN